MIYTSYYGNVKNLKGTLFCISMTHPNIEGLRFLTSVVPQNYLILSYKLGKTTPEQFKKDYLNKLTFMNQDELKWLLRVFNNEYKDCFLLCYEKPEEFCHRHILAEYIKEKFHIEVKEYK